MVWLEQEEHDWGLGKERPEGEAGASLKGTVYQAKEFGLMPLSVVTHQRILSSGMA